MWFPNYHYCKATDVKHPFIHPLHQDLNLLCSMIPSKKIPIYHTIGFFKIKLEHHTFLFGHLMASIISFSILMKCQGFVYLSQRYFKSVVFVSYRMSLTLKESTLLILLHTLVTKLLETVRDLSFLEIRVVNVVFMLLQILAIN